MSFTRHWHNKIPDLIWGLKSSCVVTCLSHIPVDQENTGKTTSMARKQLFATSSRKARAALLPRGNQNNQRVSSLSPHSQRHSEKCYSKGKNESLLQEKEGLLLKTCFSLSNQSKSTAFAEVVKVPLTYPHLLFAISFMYRTCSNGKDVIVPYCLAISVLNGSAIITSIWVLLQTRRTRLFVHTRLPKTPAHNLILQLTCVSETNLNLKGESYC